MANPATPIPATEPGDVLERLRARLDKAERRLASAQRLSRLGDWEVDLRSGLGWWSDELCAIYGVPRRDDITSEEFLDIVHPEDRDVIRHLSEAALSRTPLRCPVRIVRPDNTERLIQCRAEVEFDQAGTPLKIFGTVLDITEIGRLERALRTARENTAPYSSRSRSA